MIIQKVRVHRVRVGARGRFDGQVQQTRKPCQHENGRVEFQNLRDEARRVAKPYGAGPAEHQNFLPRTSLRDNQPLTLSDRPEIFMIDTLGYSPEVKLTVLISDVSVRLYRALTKACS